MPKWTEYTTKDTLADNDEVMLYDATGRANKRGLMSKFWDYVVDKMATAVISKLETNNKTIIGAINALNSDSITYSLAGSPNSSITTEIDVSQLASGVHYLVLLAIGHIEGDYATIGIGHFAYTGSYVGFSLFKIPGSNTLLDFSYINNGASKKIDITTISTGGINSDGILIFIR